MVFERDFNGIQVMLRIDNYQAPSKHDFGDVWCDCGYSFRFGDIIHYYKDHDELLMPEEIDELAAVLSKLLDGAVTEPCEFPMTEPDFVFWLYPEKNLRNDSKYTYIAPGCEIQDIYVAWRIFFWNGGLTKNFLTITLNRADITAFRDFLISCKK